MKNDKSEWQSQLEKDAARYRWLKENARQEGRDGGYVQLYTFPFVIKQSYPDINFANLDESIDARLQQIRKDCDGRKGEVLFMPTFESFEEALNSTKDGDVFYIRQQDI
ncbi:hypothetical protein [Klebsiella quasipneumoniae]|uniref:hypothetical protein n=1 Tax=Klebsiella quasipneumoniae TaxID=1463165 RepID=UPI0037BE5FFF